MKKINLKKIKRIEFAENKKVIKYKNIAVDFINKIFDIKDFMISDESVISDFMNYFDRSKKEEKRIYKKILKCYKIDVSEIEKPIYLWKIFEKLPL